MTDSSGLVGKKLGDYILKRRFASGGMAHIYLGEDEKLGRSAAIKVLPPDTGKHDTIMRQRFEREARAIARLEHDNIIPIYQFGEYADTYFLAMRYIEGQDLSDMVYDLHQKGELMPVEEALNILEQVASALDYAHQNNIIHRDVKPSNILVNENTARAFLSDFGLVLWQSVDQTMGTAFGTPRYISPEQATDSQSAVPQSDIYSLGVILYEILTGHPLFNAPSPLEVALAHITQTPTPPRAHNPSIPVKAQNEILKSLSKNPAQRHNSALDLIRAVREAYENTDPETAGTRPIPPEKSSSDSSPEILNQWDNMPTRAHTPAKRPTELEPPPTIPDPKATPNVRPVPTAPEDEDRPTAKIPPVTLPEKKPKTDPKLRVVAEKKAQQKRRRAQRSQAMLIGAALVGLIMLGAIFVIGSQPPASTPQTETPSDAIAAVNSDVAAITTAESSNADVTATTETQPTATATASATPTETASPTLTVTLSPTATYTPTPTLTVTLSPTPTLTPNTAPVIQVTPDPQAVPNVIARYNERVFTLTNLSDASIVISDITFTTTAQIDNFVNNNALGATLLPGDCAVIKAGLRSSAEVPEEWNCNASVAVTLNTERLFWFAEAADDTQFSIQTASTPIATCDTMGRIVRRLENGVCPFNWATTADG